MTSQRELPGSNPESSEYELNGTRWTSKGEALRVYDALWDQHHSEGLKTLPRRLRGAERKAAAKSFAERITPRPECIKKRPGCVGTTCYMIWSPGGIFPGIHWYRVGDKRYFLINICHGCGAWDDGFRIGLHGTPAERDRELNWAKTAPLTDTERAHYEKVFLKAYEKGRAKRDKYAEDKGADRYRSKRK